MNEYVHSNNSNISIIRSPPNHSFSFSQKIVPLRGIIDEGTDQNLSNLRILSQKYFVYKIRRTIPPYIRPRKSSVAIFIIRPEMRPVGLARFYITRHVLHAGKSLWRRRTSQSVYEEEAPRQTASLSLGPAIRLGVARSMGHRPPSFFSRGLLRFVVAIETV